MISCPHCGSDKSKVDSQPKSSPGVIRRYRMCQECHKTYTTLEYLAANAGKGAWVRLQANGLIPDIPTETVEGNG